MKRADPAWICPSHSTKPELRKNYFLILTGVRFSCLATNAEAELAKIENRVIRIKFMSSEGNYGLTGSDRERLLLKFP
jgi:hypothetical protein